MKGKLPKTASVATAAEGAKLHAPAAARNAEVLTALIANHAPPSGRALEIASGTGQHVQAFAAALPAIDWYPTEIAADRIASINAYGAEAGLANLRPARILDAAAPRWPDDMETFELVVLVNLLHLISAQAACNVVSNALACLSAGGRFILYGPFKRDGQLTSEGDKRFDADLRAADPAIGYKNDEEVRAWLAAAGATAVEIFEMPANNLAFVARR